MIAAIWAGFILVLVLGALASIAYRLIASHRYATLLHKGPGLLKHYNYRIKTVKYSAYSLAFLCLGAALLRPQGKEQDSNVRYQGRDIVIALDISLSMQAQDTTPDRLSCALTKMKKLTRILAHDRVGLILFASSAFVYCPLTRDHQAFEYFLDTITPHMVASEGTCIQEALKKSLELFDTLGHAHKLLVIFTDGEDFSHDLSLYKAEAQKKGVKIFTIGIGTGEGAPIPLYDEQGNTRGYQHDDKGEIVISRLNHAQLRDLSQESGAQYILGTQDMSDITELAGLLEQFDKEYNEHTVVKRAQEQYPYYVGAALVCLLLEWVL